MRDPDAREPFDVRPALIALAVLVAYTRSFAVPWLFDDHFFVLFQPEVRQLGDPLAILTARTTRPAVFLTLALNWAISGSEPYSYHALNLLLHLTGALALYGLVRRTLRLPGVPPSLARSGNSVALVAALLWALHPVSTQAVAYVWQRCESQMGMFYLLTLYAFVCAATAARAWPWSVACAAACALGMASKEVMVTAPVVVLLFDRCFVAGSFAEALRRRAPLHAALASTWVLLAVLLSHGAETFHANPGVGFGGSQGDKTAYVLTVPGLLVHYLSLALCPTGLCFDHAWPLARRPADVLVPFLALVPAFGATAWALWRRPRAGFLPAFFFLVFAPTCSVMPMPDPMAEYRLYLPLAAAACLVAVSLHLALRQRPAVALLLGLVLAVTLGGLTWKRLLVYQSAPALWLDAVRVSPDNHRGYNNLFAGAPPIDIIRRVVEVRPAVPAHRLLAVVLEAGMPGGVTEQPLQALVRDEPDLALARWMLAQMLERRGAIDEALEHLRVAQAKFSTRGGPNWTLGRVLSLKGDAAGAERAYRSALVMLPNTPGINLQLGSMLLSQGRVWDALTPLTDAAHTVPDPSRGGTPYTPLSPSDRVVARYLLGTCLAKIGGRLDLARMELLEARRKLEQLDADEARVFAADAPAFVYSSTRSGDFLFTGLFQARLGVPGLPARLAYELGRVHEAQGAVEQAVSAYREALTLDPPYEPARVQLRALGREE